MAQFGSKVMQEKLAALRADQAAHETRGAQILEELEAAQKALHDAQAAFAEEERRREESEVRHTTRCPPARMPFCVFFLSLSHRNAHCGGGGRGGGSRGGREGARRGGA